MKDIAKKRKRGFAIGETDEVRKDEIRKKEEKREAKEMQMRIDKVKPAIHLNCSYYMTRGMDGYCVILCDTVCPNERMQPFFFIFTLLLHFILISFCSLIFTFTFFTGQRSATSTAAASFSSSAPSFLFLLLIQCQSSAQSNS